MEVCHRRKFAQSNKITHDKLSDFVYKKYCYLSALLTPVQVDGETGGIKRRDPVGGEA